MQPATRRLLLVLLAAALVILVPLASATPVDPLWIPGIYDDADQDDVVGMLVDAQVLPNPGCAEAKPVPAGPRSLHSLAEPTIRAGADFTLRLRSPPPR